MEYRGLWPLKPLGTQNFAATSLATAQALTVPAGTSVILLRPAGQSVRFRDDGTNPTSTTGMTIPAGELFQYTGATPTTIRIIETAVSATLDVLYYG